MTDDLFTPTTPPNLGAPKPRKCHHAWEPAWQKSEPSYHVSHSQQWPDDRSVWACFRHEPPVIRNEAASSRGRRNRNRGNSVEREVARLVEMEHIPGNMPEDAIDDRFVAEVKSGPSWYSTRVEAELDALPVRGGRIPIYVAASTPGAGRKRRVYVTVTLGDLVKMVGPHAQVSMRAPEWVALKRETE